MRDPRDNKSLHSVSFFKILIFDLLMAIFRNLLEFFLIYPLLIMKAHLARSAKNSSFEKFENYFRFCQKIKIGHRIGLVGNSF